MIFLFDDVMKMNEAERQALRQSPEPIAPLSVEKIQKISAHTGMDLATTASTVFKNDAASYAKYRAENFRRV